MNNEEKILQILTQMQSDITDLKQGQANLEQSVSDLKQDLQFTKNVVIKIENEHGAKLKALFDETKAIKDILKRHEHRIDRLETKVDNHDMKILALTSAN